MSTGTPKQSTGAPGPSDAELESLRKQAGDFVMLGNTSEIRKLADDGVLDRVLGKVTAWGRRSSIWPMLFGTACCFIEMAASAASRYDISRFGSEVMRASPRQADLMVVAGTVTKKMAPLIVRLYHQMADPKWVMAMGACSISGGPFKDGYNVVSGIDEFIPVDIYVPGCPPKPEALLFGLMKLQEKIDKLPLSQYRWKEPASKIYPIPLLGPDIVDLRQTAEIRERMAGQTETQEAEAPAPAEEPRRRHERPTTAEASPLAPGQMQLSGDAETLAALRLALAPSQEAGDGRLVLPAERLLDVARALQSVHGWDYLSNLTSVDYPDRFEVVYHLYSSRRTGSPITMKVAAPKDEPVVDSVVGVWRGADLQEREVYDMMGIRFAGHPNLKRVLLWDGFDGFPLRKDYLEAYYEEPGKPFSSRWPSGHHIRAEERTAFGRNVRYPSGWDPSAWKAPAPDVPIVDAAEAKAGLPLTDKLTVRFGPQHPSTHGVFQMVVTLDGETIVRLEPVVGYLHRNHEKIGERNTYIQNIPYTDRLDYLSSMSNNLAYVLAVEKLMGTQVPERAEYIRVLMAEFTRISNHFLAVGTYLNDLGAYFTPVLYGFEERELILDLFEATAGSRMMCNYLRFGGVARDLPDDVLDRMRELAFERLPRSIAEVDRLVRGNEILVARSKGVSPMSAEHLLNCSITGPMLRAAGIPYDVRKVEPYSIYDRFEFEIPTGTTGDLYDRFTVRLAEMYQSLSIVQQALRDLPAGEVLTGRKLWQVRVPKGEAYARIEAPKGELGFFVVSDGGPNPYRYHVRAPSFINLTALDDMCRGLKVADSIAVFGSVDINMGECDR